MCLQGLNLSSIQDSAFNHDLALLQPVMNAVGNHWGSAESALHEVKHKHSGMNDVSLSNIRIVLKKEQDLIVGQSLFCSTLESTSHKH
jgi:hypothetical protein